MGYAKERNFEFYKNKYIGMINKNNQGELMEIIEYRNANDIDILFKSNNYIAQNKKVKDFQFGTINNNMNKTTYGVGFLGEKYIKNKKDNSYIHWASMLRRCYSESFHKKQPTYKDCIVCEEWKDYSKFKNWFDINCYKINGEKIELDKDILIKGNKIYSPETCIFVPKKINSLFVKRNKSRGDCLMGVTLDKKSNKYVAYIKENGKSFNLGRYDTEIDAFNSYKIRKENYIKQIADEYKNKIPKILYDAMYNYTVDVTD